MAIEPRPTILHIASEYLDPIRPPPTTDAVLRLVDRLTDFPQIVISLKRVNDPRKAFWRDLGMLDGRRVIAYRYFAPPLGVGMLACHLLVARRIRRFLEDEKVTPNIIHAHRFTFEGIVAWRLARQLNAALFFSVRGEVEKKVFFAKPTYRPLFQRMARDADRIYYVSAWFRDRFEAHTGADPDKTRLLPNFVHNVRRAIPETTPERRLVIPMSLFAIDKKGLPELMEALASSGPALADITLEVIGRGPRDKQERVLELAQKSGLGQRVILTPPMDNAALLAYLPSALAMVLPSHNETFGMVYPEALFAGVPILYGAGTGIDGYLDGLSVGVAVTPGNVASIRNGLIRIVNDNSALRTAIRNHADTLFERFDPDTIGARYRADVTALAKPARADADAGKE
jgi:glycosyltransferase involved in cell wall biosynthesis